jgi:3-hydroxyacyl-CoA dehydrogenase/enoyl-CoA hydratase/3-hydroxybutyryl-CoA epimerase
MIDTSGLPAPKDAPPPRSCVRIERPEPGLAVLVLDPPHRTLAVLDVPLLRDLDLAVEELEADRSLRGLVVTGRSATSFAAGADLDALAEIADPALVARIVGIGQGLFERIARLRRRSPAVRTVAAVGGAVPGGAYELALACGTIVAAESRETKIGLPETQLGILPAWGGTTRLPRRVGIPAALGAILTGRLHGAREALSKGLVDRLAYPQDLLRVASDLATGRARSLRRGRGWKAIVLDRNPLAAGFVARRARKQVMRQTRGRYPAPLAALEIAARAPRTPIARSFEAEAREASALAVSPVCKSLIGIFRASEEAKKLGRGPDGRPRRTPERAGVLGAGVMGRGIASLLAERGIWTRIFDVAPQALDIALSEHRSELSSRRKRRRIEPREETEAVDRLDAARVLEGFARCGVVIEAVAEKIEVKRSVFASVAKQVSAGAILATNTSSLSVDAIAEGVPSPERVVGMHFFNPVRRMPLVEVVRGKRTSPDAVAACAGLAVHLGKTPVVVADVAGFLVNRLLGPYLDESLRMFAGGVDPVRIDRALEEFGMPMGPLRLLDEVGFDIAVHAAASLSAAYGARMTPCAVLEPMIREGWLGKKTGRGFYNLGVPRPGARPEISPGISRFRPADAPRLALTDQEIVDRAVLAMLDEAARALEEEVVATPADLDLATVMGMGFPPFRGGLLRHADAVGAHAVVEALRRIAGAPDVAAREGGRERFEPADSLSAMATKLARFHA